MATRYPPNDWHVLMHVLPLAEALVYIALCDVDHKTENIDEYLR